MRERVYDFLKTIPEGKVTTYGKIAAFLGNKHLARVVGNILHQNPDLVNIPCHRVVNQKGQLSKVYAFGGANAQRARLEQEGVVFEQDGTVNLKKYGM